MRATTGKWLILILAIAAIIPCTKAAGQVAERTDPICENLFREYLHGGKIFSDEVDAASLLIARRGRRNGFWRVVLAELQKENQLSEKGCVRILGKMLEEDARDRRVTPKQQETMPRLAYIALGPEVVTELLKRGEKAERYPLNDYVIALARARDVRAKAFFLDILTNKARTGYMSDARFHAALGLAQLGDTAGFEWLIAHSESDMGSINIAYPEGAAPSRGLGVCCVAALRTLSGSKDLTSRKDWEAWWSQVAKPFVPQSVVQLVRYL